MQSGISESTDGYEPYHPIYSGQNCKNVNLKNFSVRTPDDFHTLFLKDVLTLGSLGIDKFQASVPDLPIRREQQRTYGIPPSREGG